MLKFAFRDGPGNCRTVNSLPWRMAALTAVLLSEAMVASLLFDSDQLFYWAPRQAAVVLGWSALWTVHFLIGLAAIFGTFFYLQYRPQMRRLETSARTLPVNTGMGVAHVAAFGACLAITYALVHRFAGAALVIPWILCGTAALWFAASAVLPGHVWAAALRETGKLPFYAALGAAAASSVVQLSGRLWIPMRRLDFSRGGDAAAAPVGNGEWWWTQRIFASAQRVAPRSSARRAPG